MFSSILIYDMIQLIQLIVQDILLIYLIKNDSFINILVCCKQMAAFFIHQTHFAKYMFVKSFKEYKEQ